MTLPKQFPSWYAFWLDMTRNPNVSKAYSGKVHFSSGETSDDGEMLFDTYDLAEVKAKAFDEVSKFLPTNEKELGEVIHGQTMLYSHHDKGLQDWYEFYKLLNQQQ